VAAVVGRGGGARAREYDWARVSIRIGWQVGPGHWLLARRKISDPIEIAYYVCYGPRRATLLDLAWIAGARWRIGATTVAIAHASGVGMEARCGVLAHTAKRFAWSRLLRSQRHRSQSPCRSRRLLRRPDHETASDLWSSSCAAGLRGR
jgi:hypothetical protein